MVYHGSTCANRITDIGAQPIVTATLRLHGDEHVLVAVCVVERGVILSPKASLAVGVVLWRLQRGIGHGQSTIPNQHAHYALQEPATSTDNGTGECHMPCGQFEYV